MKKKKISNTFSIYLRFLHQESGWSKAALAKRYPEYARRSICRHASKSVEEETVDKRKKNPGRPKKLNEREERLVMNTMKKLRNDTASFTAKKIHDESNLKHVSTKTIHRVLHKNGFKYLHARKKGLVSAQDKMKRLQFARNAKATLATDFWKNGLAFYFDGVNFAHKGNPYAEAQSTATMAWRKPSEGLNMTGKGKKEGSGGKVAKFFVGMAYNKGTVLCKRYEWRLNGENFASFVSRQFPRAFQNCGVDMSGAYFLMDGCPSQNSSAAKEEYDRLGCKIFSIPARSPDLNMIENIFHLIRVQLKSDAVNLKIEKESFPEFCERVSETIKNFPVEVINKTIESMNKRIELIIESKGNRIKY